MTLSEPGKIDIVAESPEGEIVLAIVATGDWDDVAARHDELARKLGTYIDYMHSPEYRERFGTKDPVVHLVTPAEPPPAIRELLDATESASGIPIQVHAAGGGRAGPVADADPEPATRAEPARPEPLIPADAMDSILAAALDRTEEDQDRERIRKIRSTVGVLGFAVAFLAALVAWDRSRSIALALFTFVMVQFLISRGVADVITDPNKVQRAIYFSLTPLLATGVLWLAWRQWQIMWLAALLGFFGGLVLNGLIAPRLFPRVHQEEQRDSARRLKEAKDKREAAQKEQEGSA